MLEEYIGGIDARRSILGRICNRILASGKKGISIRSLSKLERIAYDIIVEIVKDIEDKGIIKIINNETVVPLSKLKLAIYCISQGVPVDQVSLYLHWRDFEELVSEYLAAHNYVVYRSLRISPPRGLEVDVIGQKGELGLVIDCKHWNPGYSKISKLKQASIDHYNRVKILAKKLWILARKHSKLRELRKLVPIIVTLTDVNLRFYQGVLISPISLFNDFLLNIDAILDHYNCIVRVVCYP